MCLWLPRAAGERSEGGSRWRRRRRRGWTASAGVRGRRHRLPRGRRSRSRSRRERRAWRSRADGGGAHDEGPPRQPRVPGARSRSGSRPRLARRPEIACAVAAWILVGAVPVQPIERCSDIGGRHAERVGDMLDELARRVAIESSGMPVRRESSASFRPRWIHRFSSARPAGSSDAEASINLRVATGSTERYWG